MPSFAKLDDGKMIKYLDIGKSFLDKDGAIPGDVMPDKLHPNAKGYQIWADAMNATLGEMLGAKIEKHEVSTPEKKPTEKPAEKPAGGM